MKVMALSLLVHSHSVNAAKDTGERCELARPPNDFWCIISQNQSILAGIVMCNYAKHKQSNMHACQVTHGENVIQLGL